MKRTIYIIIAAGIVNIIIINIYILPNQFLFWSHVLYSFIGNNLSTAQATTKIIVKKNSINNNDINKNDINMFSIMLPSLLIQDQIPESSLI